MWWHSWLLNRQTKISTQLLRSKDTLVVVNRVLDENHPVLSHQINVVNSLARFFENVVVLTGNVGTFTLSQNVSVVNCKWIEGNNIRNSLVFYLKALPLLMKRDCVFFFHMTDVQSALLAPLTLCFRVKHVLWYAHKKVSIYLWITSFFNRIILTASAGSCSLPKKKFSVIGHGIETELFNFKERCYIIWAFNRWRIK